jgi:hypothetical protein
VRFKHPARAGTTRQRHADLVGSSTISEDCRIGAALLLVAMGDAEISLERPLHPVETGHMFEAGKPWLRDGAQHAANNLDVHGGLRRKWA